jgi:murein DD-endopeptidase MepM/ murein hydrolase activator NlpD
MTLNLRIRRTKPRRFRRQLLLLLLSLLLVAAGLVWHNGGSPEQALALINQAVAARISDKLPGLSTTISNVNPNLKQAESPQLQSAAVVMVEQNVVENPRSDAFTADLYQATGRDEIPWPNIDGRTRVEIYTVQSGDSLWSISNEFGLDIDTLRWSNLELERNPDVLAVDTELNILPVLGVYHTVADSAETIETVAQKYGVSPREISGYPPNALFPPYDLEVGDQLIVPYGRKDITLPQPTLAVGNDLSWPVVGSITGGFTANHTALDIGAPYGSTVYAAAAGMITYADWAYDGYGYTVIIDHGDGRETWYNHLKGALLPAGNFVERGTPVGEVGSTGHSSGPHVHFEVRINGSPVNPTGYLAGGSPQ